MSLTAYNWSLALHVIGVLLWVGGLLGLVITLRSIAGEASSGLLTAGKKFAGMMNVGALIAIAIGVYVLVRSPAALMKQPWMHIKLTAVVLGPFAIHGYLQVQLKKARNNQFKGLSPIVPMVLTAAIVAIVILVIVKPLAK